MVERLRRYLSMLESISDLPVEARLRERERPAGSPVMYQRWDELLFLHWPVDPVLVQEALPEGLRVDTFEGQAWIGVVPFEMRDVRPRGLPAVPGISNFPELNLRTYVIDAQDRPGVWFYSLDTPQSLANWIARNLFFLNYRMARFRIEAKDGQIRYQSELKLGESWDEPQLYDWTRVGETFEAEPGSLDFFLAERYRLFAYNPKKKKLLTGQVHHAPYPLQRIELSGFSKRLFGSNGIAEPAGAPLSALGSAGVQVEIFPMEP